MWLAVETRVIIAMSISSLFWYEYIWKRLLYIFLFSHFSTNMGCVNSKLYVSVIKLHAT